jgi:hypothetical protein
LSFFRPPCHLLRKASTYFSAALPSSQMAY